MSEAPNCETTKPILSLQTKQKNQKKKNLKKRIKNQSLKNEKGKKIRKN